MSDFTIISGPQTGTSLERIRQTLRVSTIEGGFTCIFMNWTSGSILIGFLLSLGAGPTSLALLASLPLITQLIGPFCAWLVERFPRRMPFIMVVSSFSRFAWVFAVFLPMLDLELATKLHLALGLVAWSCVFQAAGAPPWIALMADVVPASMRGRYFGARNAIVGLITMVGGLGAGWFMDWWGAPSGFQIVFAVGLLFALIGIILYTRYHEPEPTVSGLSLGDMWRVPLRDPAFRKFLWFSMYWQGAVMLAAPFVVPYFLQHLHMTYSQIAIWSAIAAICAMATGPLWGRVADEAGHKTVLAITTFLAGSFHPLCWMLATPGHLEFIWISGFMDALSWGGIGAALFNLGIAAAPPRERLAYLSVLGAANGLAGFIGGMLSGPLLKHLLELDFFIGSFHWTGYHTLFLASGILRMNACRMIGSIHEPGARSALDALRVFRAAVMEWFPILGR